MQKNQENKENLVQKQQNITTQRLVMLSLMVSLNVILSRFLSISTQEIKIGFSFIPVAIAAITLGPIYGGIVGGLGDLVGALLFPIGAYFPGFTLCAFLTGWIYGMILHKQQSNKRIIIAVVVSEVICSLLINTLWLTILYGMPYGATLMVRSVQSSIMTIVEIVVIGALVKYVPFMKRVTIK